MKLRLTNLFLLSIISINCYSQKTATTISGKLISANNPTSNIHIINLQTKRGTISNEYGEFEISVSVRDVLLISSLEYENIKITIQEFHIKAKSINIQLTSSINNLDEVFLHGLSGSLNLDLNKTPLDTLPKHNFSFKLSDLDKKLPEDIHGFLKAPNAQDMTDPIKMGGGGAGATIPDFYMINLRKLKADLKLKKDFPSKMISEFGIDFFTKNLKIPKEKINHFLAYCEFRDIIEYYKKNNLLEVIKILREESKIYNEINFE